MAFNPYAATRPAFFKGVKGISPAKAADEGSVLARDPKMYPQYLELAERLGVSVAKVMPFNPQVMTKSPLDVPVDPRDAGYMIKKNGARILAATQGMDLSFGGYTDAQVRTLIQDYGKGDIPGQFPPEILVMRHNPLLKAAVLGVAPDSMQLGNKFSDSARRDNDTIPLELQDMVREHVAEYNRENPGRLKLDAQEVMKVLHAESGGQGWGFAAHTGNGAGQSARGPWQFIDSSARLYGMTLPDSARGNPALDPRMNYDLATKAAVQHLGDAAEAMGKADARSMYWGYQQGIGAASVLRRSPGANAAAVLGTDHVVKNNGSTEWSVARFAQHVQAMVYGGEPHHDRPRSVPETHSIYGVDFAPEGGEGRKPDLKDEMTFYGPSGSEIPLVRDHVFSPLSGDEMKAYQQRFNEYRALPEEGLRALGAGHLKRLGYLDFDSTTIDPASGEMHQALNAFRKDAGLPVHRKAGGDTLSLTEAVAMGAYVARVDKYGARQQRQEFDIDGLAIDYQQIRGSEEAVQAAEPQTVLLKYALMEAGMMQPEMQGRGKAMHPVAPDGTVDDGFIEALDNYQKSQGFVPKHGNLDMVTTQKLMDGLVDGMSRRGVSTVAGLELDPALFEHNTFGVDRAKLAGIDVLKPQATTLEEIADGKHRFEVSRTDLYRKGKDPRSEMVQQMGVELGVGDALGRHGADGDWAGATDRMLKAYAEREGLQWNGKGDARELLGHMRDAYVAKVSPQAAPVAGVEAVAPAADAKSEAPSAPAVPAKPETQVPDVPSSDGAVPAQTAPSTAKVEAVWDGSARYKGGYQDQVKWMQQLLQANDYKLKDDGFWQGGTNGVLAQAAKDMGVKWKAGEDPSEVVEALQQNLVRKMSQPVDARGIDSPVSSFAEVSAHGALTRNPSVADPAVAWAQSRMQFLGQKLDPSRPDGKYGASSERAFAAMAKEHGVSHSEGTVSLEELKAIDESVAKRLKYFGVSPTEAFGELASSHGHAGEPARVYTQEMRSADPVAPTPDDASSTAEPAAAEARRRPRPQAPAAP